MTSRQLWRLLLVERSPFPLFIRIAPRAHIPSEASVWDFLAWYTGIALYLSVLVAPFMFNDILLGVLFVVFGSPAFITVLIAVVGSPFVVFGGLFFGTEIASRVSTELAYLRRSALTELLQAAPAGRWGLLRSVSAAYLRQREVFFGAGFYEMVAAHRTLAIGIAIPAGWVASIGFLSTTFSGRPFLDFPVWGWGLALVLTIAIPPVLTILLHLDFRQVIILGVTAGVFGGTVTGEETQAWTGTLGILTASTLVNAALIVGMVLLARWVVPPPHTFIAYIIATLLGWAAGLAAREWLVRWTWRQILSHEELEAIHI